MVFLGLLVITSSACTTLGQLPCETDQIVRYDGAQWTCDEDNNTLGDIPSQGVIWLNHHDMVVKDTDRIIMSTNGTSIFLSPKLGIAFPERELVPLYIPALTPGFNITGVRVCYGIVGDHPDTEVHRLRLAQFQPGLVGGTNWPGYTVKLEASNTGPLAPTPPPAGFAYNEGAGFSCVDSASETWKPCLDPAKGTIAATTGVQIGDQDDRLVIQAIGVRYDLTCTPN